jgi:ribonucleotide monophosphatase NagD (HAD superfamily)
MNGRPQALLLDVEGVLVDYRVALAGALDTVREARRRGLAIRLVTNTATRHHEQLLQELRTLGFAVEAKELFTAPLALVHPAIAPLFQGQGARRGPSRAVDGHWMLDTGAFLQALEYGASCEATVLDKPSAAFFAEVVQSLGLPADSCLMVGDDVEADVQGAIAAGR